jgi:hypothetical protein
MFPHRNIYTFNWSSNDRNTPNQIEYNSTDTRRHSSAHDVPFFRAADYDTDQFMVVAKVRERQAVSKQTTKKEII